MTIVGLLTSIFIKFPKVALWAIEALKQAESQIASIKEHTAHKEIKEEVEVINDKEKSFRERLEANKKSEDRINSRADDTNL